MTTLTIDILNDKALALLKDLELLKIIRVRENKRNLDPGSEDLIAKYKGAMTPQSLNDIDNQLNSLRDEWE